MNITDYILNETPPLHLKSTIDAAEKLFDSFLFSHFPVVENNKIIGCFAKEDLQIIENKFIEIGDCIHLLNSFFTVKKTTDLNLLKIFADNDTNIIPVVDENSEYVGYYYLSDVLEVISTRPFILEANETLIIEKATSDFSMSEISQIIESTGGKLLGMYISEIESSAVQITLQIKTEDIYEIINSYRRYTYKIVSSHENDVYLEDLKNRSDYLRKYLEM
jgi:predicted transcriptional regulator